MQSQGPKPFDYVTSPVRVLMLAWSKFLKTEEHSIADIDITITDLKEARVHALTMAFILLLVGAGLIVAHIHIREVLETHPGGPSETTWSLMTSHFGVAFLVAALAGFGYDIFAHHYKLQQQIFTLFRINHSVAELQIEAVLQKLLSNRTGDYNIHDQLRKNIAATIHSIAAIDAVSANASVVSLRFISRLLRYARDAAHTLELAEGSNSPHELTLPSTAASLADEILAAQLRVLADGDEYSVVSDLSTWHDWQLRHFWDALETTKATIQVSRVFCFFKQDVSVAPCEAREIIRRHWQLAERLLVERLSGKSGATYNVAVSMSREAEHVGVFRHGETVTSFRPHGAGRLTSLTISHDNDTPIFADLWRDAVKFIDDDGKKVSFEHLISELDRKNFFRAFKGCKQCAKVHLPSCDCNIDRPRD